MSRLIDADKLLGLFIESGQKHGSEHGCKLGENWLLDYNDIKAVIDNAPTVDTTFREVVAYECGQKSVGKWIPVNDRLPEVRIDSTTNDFEEVLCSTKFGKVRTYKYGKPIGHTEAHFWYGWGIMDNAIIAWQPLPEPYKADMRGDV